MSASKTAIPTGAPLLEVEGLAKHFDMATGMFKRTKLKLRAVDGVSFALSRGETLCIVGESGCGKSTVGKLILRLMQPSAGAIRIDGSDITRASGEVLRAFRKRVQMIFQDPFASLNPRLRAGTIVGEPLENYHLLSAKGRKEKVADLFARVGLRPETADKFPFEFSGGQRQRLGIARALALSPDVIVADEPVSALDVSVQAQVLNLLVDLREALGLAYIFISHDLGVVEHIAHRVAVMYLGRIVEIGDKRTIFDTPRHPYTQALIAAAPVADPRAKRRQIVLEGDVPSPLDPPTGCAFHPRCPYAFARCRVEAPVLTQRGAGHLASCHLEQD
ncbi:peptide/nickel transport system ATP-binding protein [Rhizobiales bacterium GAS191]|nr:peptide/nickel transport system ATP-binding protein [Rhizobiales bacterium GAS113]SEC43679.1 peptide/nickel transport system ATP-binding protein [Rhizobiales bacterium GAS191]SEC82429.1 peptide/nickel transport system ATP-binding protein [Rhizobiales bacterium GAS188]